MFDQQRKRRRRVGWIKRTSLSVVTVLVVLLAARSSLARAYRVEGASDAPTLCIGDRVWINLAAYDLRLPFTHWKLLNRGDPESGEMVLCHVPGKSGMTIKRVIAVGGDTVVMRDNRLFINGQGATYEPLDSRSFHDIPAVNKLGDRFDIERIGGINHMISYEAAGSSVSDSGPVTVPKDHYFVLGDNRDNSYDSRTAACGLVPRRAIMGRMIGSGRPYR